MLHRLIRVAVLAISIAAALALVFAPTTASAAPAAATIHVAPQAQLLTGGTPGVIVTVTYTCLDNSGFGNEVISKDGFSSGADFLATCDNHSHTVELFNPGPYTPGIAPVFAHVQSFSGISRADTNVQVTIK